MGRAAENARERALGGAPYGGERGEERRRRRWDAGRCVFENEDPTICLEKRSKKLARKKQKQKSKKSTKAKKAPHMGPMGR